MKLSAYVGTPIKPNGTCKLTCTSNCKVCDVMFYVALINAQPILDFNDCVQLDLVKRVGTLQLELIIILTVLKKSGDLGTYHITMVDNCTESGVLIKVDQPTDNNCRMP